MAAKSSAAKIRMESLDSLLGGSTVIPMPQRGEAEAGDRLLRLPLDKLHTYHSSWRGHPFRVLDDAKMAETVESIEKHGVLIPGIARPDRDYPGEYEIIAGHRRRRASELAGLQDMPFIVRELSDEEATVIMVDSNIQREDLLPSEKAWAYRMKYDALKKLAGRDQADASTAARTEDRIRTDQLLAAEAGESRNSIQRYIRLTYLAPELLQLVDEGKLPKSPAEELSHLKISSQHMVRKLMEELGTIPTGEQAKKLKELDQETQGYLRESVIRLVLEKPADPSKFSLPSKRIRQYFPESYTGEEIQEVIYQLLEEWQKKGGHK